MLDKIRECKNINDITTTIIENSYNIYLNNYHHKKDFNNTVNWKHSEGLYLSLKASVDNPLSNLNILCSSIRKKLLQIYYSDINEFNDFEFYETLVYTELYSTLKELENKLGFNYIKSQFKNVQTSNKFCGTILTIIVNKNMKRLQKNQLSSVIAKSTTINGKTVWKYETVKFANFDSTISTNKDEVMNLYDYIVYKSQNYNGSDELGIYDTDEYNCLYTNEPNNRNIISYLAKNLNLLTSNQRYYLKSATTRNYKTDAQIRDRFIRKLSIDKNVKIKLNEDSKLESIELTSDYKKSLDIILSQRTNEQIFNTLIEFIKKNNKTSDLLLDLILDCDTKFYKPIIDKLNDKDSNIDYIENQFKHVTYKLKLAYYKGR
ncbi:hypothetical protein [Paraclostridium tenue]|uniref:Uncharacterized protein n=1 Tax=Paraclostridium tenue TaxID=1737 RepID=A0ABN1M2W9_9FIRM|nr:hypothetical protein [[Eubacterium] tenue]MBC8630755.1 hypothetical protein [[Eubacterium] tenue]